MINPLDNMNFEKRNFVSHSKYIKDDDIFISLKNGIKYLSQEDINKLSLILVDSKFEQYDNPKILKINKGFLYFFPFKNLIFCFLIFYPLYHKKWSWFYINYLHHYTTLKLIIIFLLIILLLLFIIIIGIIQVRI